MFSIIFEPFAVDFEVDCPLHGHVGQFIVQVMKTFERSSFWIVSESKLFVLFKQVLHLMVKVGTVDLGSAKQSNEQ